MNIGKQLKEGLFTQNPVVVRLTGFCVALAAATGLCNGLGVGVCVLAVLTLSNAILSALGLYLPRRFHAACAVVTVATLGAMADLLVQAFFPDLAGDLGLFLPLTAVTCVLLSGGGAYAYENDVVASTVEGLCQGLGYAMVLVLTGTLREVLGTGMVGLGLFNGGRGVQVFPSQFAASAMVGPVGGFLVLACVAAAVQFVGKGFRKKREAEKG